MASGHASAAKASRPEEAWLEETSSASSSGDLRQHSKPTYCTMRPPPGDRQREDQEGPRLPHHPTSRNCNFRRARHGRWLRVWTSRGLISLDVLAWQSLRGRIQSDPQRGPISHVVLISSSVPVRLKRLVPSPPSSSRRLRHAIVQSFPSKGCVPPKLHHQLSRPSPIAILIASTASSESTNGGMVSVWI